MITVSVVGGLSVRFAHPLGGSAGTANYPLSRRSLHARLAELRSTRPARTASRLSTDDPRRRRCDRSRMLRSGQSATVRRCGLLFSLGTASADAASDEEQCAAARCADRHLAPQARCERADAADGLVDRSTMPGRLVALVQRADLEYDDRATAEGFSRCARGAGEDERIRGRVLPGSPAPAADRRRARGDRATRGAHAVRSGETPLEGECART